MLVFPVFLLTFGSALANHLFIPPWSVRRDPNTVLVLWGTRHGNRHPEKFLQENPRSWGYEGNTELTMWGKRQAYGLGKELRNFVGRMVDTNFNASQVKYYSSSANRCQMTLQTVLAGFHEPTVWADWNRERHDFWSPVPYSIDDKLIRMYAVDECPNNKRVWEPIDNDALPHLMKLMMEKREILDYMQANTGWNMSNLGKAADVADNLIEIDLYRAKYPDWIARPTLRGYTPEIIKKEILSFAEIHQNACAEYAPCGELMAGVWLDHILKSIEDARVGKGPKVIGYASHTEITLSAMKIMGVVKDELTTSAGFVIEFRNKPTPAVRILNHDPNPIDKHVIYKAQYLPHITVRADADGFIPLAIFYHVVRPKAIADWKKACGVQGCGIEL